MALCQNVFYFMKCWLEGYQIGNHMIIGLGVTLTYFFMVMGSWINATLHKFERWGISIFYENTGFILLNVWFDSLRPINNLSVIKGRVFLG